MASADKRDKIIFKHDIFIHIFSFIESIKTSFKILYELTLKATAITIPITIYQIIQVSEYFEVK